jgi:uncharacterized protein (TIGR04222 family)
VNAWGALGLYLVAALVVALAARALRSAGPGTPRPLDLGDPYRLAFLAGHPYRAVVAAVAALSSRGLVGASSTGRVLARIPAGGAPADLPAFEAAVLAACARPRAPSRIAHDHGVRRAAGACEASLAGEGLLESPEATFASRGDLYGIGVGGVLLGGGILLWSQVDASALGRDAEWYFFLPTLAVAAAASWVSQGRFPTPEGRASLRVERDRMWSRVRDRRDPEGVALRTVLFGPRNADVEDPAVAAALRAHPRPSRLVCPACGGDHLQCEVTSGPAYPTLGDFASEVVLDVLWDLP